MGDVIGDLNKRRGRIMGMNPTKDGEQVVEAEVPMAEMSTYAIDLRAMTQSAAPSPSTLSAMRTALPRPSRRPLRKPRPWRKNKSSGHPFPQEQVPLQAVRGQAGCARPALLRRKF